ncbi:efflux transporter periplasmic adaptor subunit [Bacillus sp. V3-13]|uniref:efflux RND transporter periplasmic adaptor subunit n=1 Tax=Bacillus sp. V3-13 TaxID=2053728 RepID=UPI000C775E03|nr:efflux RND transporter periplasmic adaptor subunit [Bacillus sp. V3-13]PLR75425.1 efflux transporter periplasmic adaptor subunit [Bacillus sp. V3-13]
MHPEQINNPKKKWVFFGVIAFILAAVAVNVAIIKNKDLNNVNNLKLASVTNKQISNTKLISGVVVPGKKESFYLDSTKGIVKEFFVEEGQTVSTGQKLFSYDNPDLDAEIKQLEIDKKIASVQYEQNQGKIDSLRKQIDQQKNEIKKKDIDPLQSQLQVSQYQQTITELEAQLKDVQYQQRTTELEIQKNKVQADELQRKKDGLIVYSTIDGIVQRVDKDTFQGSTHTSDTFGTPIVQIIAQGDLHIEGTLSELQKFHIKQKQPITVSSKANTDTTWKGEITEVSEYPISEDVGSNEISTPGQTTQNISYYTFKASLADQKGLASGYHVSIQVELPQTTIRAVPRSSIVQSEDSLFVYVLNGARLRKQEVKTGVGDSEWIEVLEGLALNDKVVDSPSSKVQEVMEVKLK